MSADARVRSFIDRILRLKQEQDDLARDIRDVYAEAKGEGYNKTAMGEVVAHLRRVEKKGEDAVRSALSDFDLYLDAYERATGTPIARAHTHEADRENLSVEIIKSSGDVFVDLGFTAEEGRKIVADRTPPSSAPTSSPVATKEPEAIPLPTSGSASFKLRPHCRKPDACAGVGKKHCHACTTAMSATLHEATA